MRRKLTAALLTAAMAISLTACGGSGDTASAGASTGETASVTEAGGTTTASGKEVLRVAMSADYAPFDWLQEDDSNGAVMTSNGSYMNGYDVLVAKYIAEKLDMDLEITQIDWDGLILSILCDRRNVHHKREIPVGRFLGSVLQCKYCCGCCG